MVGAKHLLVDGQCTLVERFGLAVLALVPVEQCQLVECIRYIGMVGAKHLLTDGERSLVERFGLAVLALLFIECCQTVETVCYVGMIGAKHLLTDGEGMLQEWFGLLTLFQIMHSQIIETERYVGMIGAKHLLTDGEGMLVEGLGLAVLALVIIEHSQIIETERYVGMIGAKHLLTDGEGTLVEGLGFSILCTLMQVVSCSIEQMSSFRGRDIPLCNECRTGLCVQDKTLTERPLCNLSRIREDMDESSCRSLNPLALLALEHAVSENSLHKAVYGKCVCARIATQQRVGTQRFHHFIQSNEVA